jgi:hypothetical protein
MYCLNCSCTGSFPVPPPLTSICLPTPSPPQLKKPRPPYTKRETSVVFREIPRKQLQLQLKQWEAFGATVKITRFQSSEGSEGWDSSMSAVSGLEPQRSSSEVDGLLGMESSQPGPGGVHPNIFVRGFPLNWGEAEISAVFQQFGQLSSMRLVRHSVTKHSLG